MRFSKTAWLILGLGILIIAAAALYTIYLRQGGEQARLNDALNVAQTTIPRLAEERSNLEIDLGEAEDELEDVSSRLRRAKLRFPNAVESIEVDEQLFSIASEWNLDMTILTATEPGDENIEIENLEKQDVTFFITTFVIRVRGAEPAYIPTTQEGHKDYIIQVVNDIVGFVDTIATRGDFIMTSMEVVNMVVPEPLTDDELDDWEDQILDLKVPSAEVTLKIYGYKGE